MTLRFLPLLILGTVLLAPAGLRAQDPVPDPLAAADSAWVRGEHDRAFRIYAELHREGRAPALALHRMALVHLWNDRPADALPLLDQALDREPEYVAAQRERGLLRGRLGDLDGATSDLERFLESEPDDLDALEALARYHSWTGRYDPAIRAYDRLLEADPGRTEARLARARVLSWDGRLDEAAEAYREILAEDPDNVEVLVGLGQVLSWTGRMGEARRTYERALALDPDNVGARRGLAQVATWGGDLRQGELLWREALAGAPDDGDNLMGLASNLRMQRREREAGRYLARVREVAPDNPGLPEEEARLTRALRPRVSPSWNYSRDSDRNRIHVLAVTARWKPLDPVELSAAVGWSRLVQTNRPELDQRVVTARVEALTRGTGGWGVRGGVGVWNPTAAGSSAAGTALIGVSMPPWWRVRGDLTLSRSVFDVTALVADARVILTELSLAGSARTSDRGNLYGSFSTARFRGSETNTRHLAALRYVHRVRPWLHTGPGIRTFSFERTVDDGYWNPTSYFLAELPVTLTSSRGEWAGRVETAPGYQRSGGEADPWSPSFRIEAGVTRDLTRGGQVGFSAVYADSGAQRLSGADGEGYRFRGFTLSGMWPL